MEAQPKITQNISSLKLPMLRTGDYDLWTVGTVVLPKTEAHKLARKNELKAKSTLLLAIPDEHLLKFHSINDAKSLWEAIKKRVGGNKESKKMHKTILKQQYENFVASRSKELDKTYDMWSVSPILVSVRCQKPGHLAAKLECAETKVATCNQSVTKSIKVNGVTDDALSVYLFSHSLTHHTTVWFDRLPRNSITTFEQMAKMFLGKYFPPSMVTKLRNEITNFRQRPDESLFEAWERYMLSIDRCPNHNMLPVTQIDTFYNGLTLRHRDTINAAADETFMKRRIEECYDLIENMIAHHNDWDTSAQRIESSCSITSFFDPEIVALKAEMAELTIIL
nr:reverse transcriptase domain-containing protein [Tanacetum cinerariifolium]